MPKVHKLKEAASVYNEKDLTARPIVTGYGWSVVKASRILQKNFREIIIAFKRFLLGT